jgi:16S rRNA (guanine1516-N2)-methyltransferase
MRRPQAGVRLTADRQQRVVMLPPFGDDDAAHMSRFGIPCGATAEGSEWTLRRRADGALELRSPAAGERLSVVLDPDAGALRRRLATARADQPLPRAVGLRRRRTAPTVFDATAGLGRDALLLARLGCTVTACERVPLFAAMLADAARRAGLEARLDVRCGEAETELARLGSESRPDVVCLDPMFPAAERAQVKKEMQVCRMLAGAAGDEAGLLRTAMAAARERVVVKRHPRDPPLGGLPSFSVAGRSVRFDVYLVAAGVGG